MSDRFPFPIPNGWFQVEWSHELKAGDVKPLKYFGKDLVLFRDEDGAAHLLDAFCPHLGAHLGHGGTVEGKSIVCPFHAWKFDGSGTCSAIPYAEKIPKQAKLNAWTIVERNGMIVAWHHSDGAPPQWEVPTFSELGDEDWSEPDHRTWTVGTCNQEMAENAVDTAHFFYLHGTAEMPKSEAKIIDKHTLHVVAQTVMATKHGPVPGQIDVYEYGFGINTTRFTGLVETFLMSSNTPIDENSCDLRFTFVVKKFGNNDITRGIGRAYVKEIARQLEQDIPVWENKVYLSRPVLVAEDGPIGLFRTWAKGQYS